MDDTPRSAEIREEMARIRCDLHDDVEGVVENARVISDWRYYPAAYPWAAVAAAAGLGYMIVPRRVQIVSPDPEVLERLARKQKLVVAPPKAVRERKGLGSQAFSFLASLAVRGLLAYLGQQAGKHVGRQAAEAESAPGPSYYAAGPR